jgi:phosphohistidine phosphatase
MADKTPPILQACAVPYRTTEDGGIEFCLITSSGRGDWIFPKGIIDPGETPKQTAAKEAWEEAGLHGKIEGKPVGEYGYGKWGASLQVTAYLMRVAVEEDHWEEADFRKRCWCAPKEARKLISRTKLLKLLEAAVARLEKVDVIA